MELLDRLLPAPPSPPSWATRELHGGWLDDPLFRPIMSQDLVGGQHRNPDPVGRSSSPPPISTLQRA